MAATLYAVPASHPCACVERALQLKGDRVPPRRHAAGRPQGDPEGAVRRRHRARARARRREDPRLAARSCARSRSRCPSRRCCPPTRRSASRSSWPRSWGDEVLQPLVRRVIWAALRRAPARDAVLQRGLEAPDPGARRAAQRAADRARRAAHQRRPPTSTSAPTSPHLDQPPRARRPLDRARGGRRRAAERRRPPDRRRGCALLLTIEDVARAAGSRRRRELALQVVPAATRGACRRGVAAAPSWRSERQPGPASGGPDAAHRLAGARAARAARRATQRDAVGQRRRRASTSSSGTSTNRRDVTSACGSRQPLRRERHVARAAARRRRSAAARAARRPPRGPSSRSTALHASSSASGLELRLDPHDRVEELRLVEHLADRLGVVDRRRRQHAHAVRGQRVDRGLQVRAAVADVRAEPEVADHRGLRTIASWRDWASRTPSSLHSSPSSSHVPPAPRRVVNTPEHPRVLARRDAGRRAPVDREVDGRDEGRLLHVREGGRDPRVGERGEQHRVGRARLGRRASRRRRAARASGRIS